MTTADCFDPEILFFFCLISVTQNCASIDFNWEGIKVVSHLVHFPILAPQVLCRMDDYLFFGNFQATCNLRCFKCTISYLFLRSNSWITCPSFSCHFLVKCHFCPELVACSHVLSMVCILIVSDNVPFWVFAAAIAGLSEWCGDDTQGCWVPSRTG